MSKRKARPQREAEQAETTPSPLDQILDGPGGGDVPMLIAPYVVRNSASGAAALRRQNKLFRTHVDREIPVFMKELQKLFEAAQTGHWHIQKHGTPHRLRHSIGEQNLTEDQLKRRYEKDVREYDAARASVDGFVAVASRVFGRGFADAVMNNLSTLYLSDRDQPMPYSGEKRLYLLGTDSVHFYLAVATQRCEICNWYGNRCAPCVNKIHALSLVPRGHQMPRLMHTRLSCIESCCVLISSAHSDPLKIDNGRVPNTIRGNNELLKRMLTQVGVPRPYPIDELALRMRKVYNAPPGSQMLVTRGDSLGTLLPGTQCLVQGALEYWLMPHPALPAKFSMVEKLGLEDVVEAARADIRRASKWDAKIAVLIHDQKKEKLIADFEALVSTRCGVDTLLPSDPTIRTLAQLNTACPGIESMIRWIVGRAPNVNSADHFLELQHGNRAASVACGVFGTMRARDMAMTGTCASAHAYSFVSGFCHREDGLGMSHDWGLPSRELDARLSGLFTDLYDWDTFVTTMHVFDAIKWNRLSITTERVELPPRLFPEETHTNLTWHIELDGEGENRVTLSGGCRAIPTHSTRPQDLRKACCKRLDDLDLEADLPPVPAETSPERDVEMNAWYKEVLAQTMAYHPETRAMALAILTGGDPAPVIMKAVREKLASGELNCSMSAPER